MSDVIADSGHGGSVGVNWLRKCAGTGQTLALKVSREKRALLNPEIRPDKESMTCAFLNP